MYYVYCIENYITKKVYIGQTKIIRRRINEHLRLLKSNTHYNKVLQEDWNAHLEKSFIFTILEKNVNTYDEACDLEKYYIKLSDSTNSKFGYNQTTGGTDGTFFNDTMRQAMSKRMKGSIKTIEQKRKMSISAMGRNIGKEWTSHQRSAITNALHNQVQSEETKKKRALKQTGSGNHRFGKSGALSASYGKPGARRRKVNCYTLDGKLFKTFNFLKEASDYFGLRGSGSIVACCKGKQKTAKGYIFKYKEEK